MKQSVLARIAKLEAKQVRPAGTFPSVVELRWNETCEHRLAELEAEGYVPDPNQPVVFISRFAEEPPAQDHRPGGSPTSGNDRYADYGASNEIFDINSE